MKYFKRILLGISIITTGLLLFLSNDVKTYAASINSNLSLHEQTKIYSSNNPDYFYGCEDYDDYVSQSPEITVLTHGLGSQGHYWSNDISIKDGTILAYNSNSLIDKIYTKLNGNVLIYLAKCDNETSFQLSQYNRYLTSIRETERLYDVSKHIILIYESSKPDASNNDVYEEFENVLDTISMQYKSITGVLPRFNLVGHSRGGITNIMYATEHPYNVASMFSLGTPYNGSALGGIDAVLAMLGYVDENTGELIPGVQSLLDYNEAVKIRDNWNEAYKEDVNMNVVAYGSMVSIDYIEEMIIDAANGTSEYAPVLQPYLDLMQTVINVVKKYPNLVGGTLDFVQGLALVANAFGINLYDEVLSNISSDLEGSVTYEEGQKILGLYNVINGQAVIMDDLFIDLNSQLGYGFKDNVDFNGFKRYVKIFQPEDLTANRSIPTLPAVVHNLETMNETYTNAISGALVYGTHTNNITALGEGSLTSVSLLGEKVFSFTSSYSGVRKFTASGTEISLYGFNEVNGLELLDTAENSITYNYQRGQKYWIVISKNLKSNVPVSFELLETLSINDNIITISKNDRRIFKLVAEESGYYMIDSSTSNIAISGVTSYATGKYYTYMPAGTTKYIYLINNASYELTANISVTTPQEISLEEGEFIVGTSQKILKFTNPYNTSVQFKLNTSWTASTTKYAYIYNQNNASIASVVIGTKTRTYSFTLTANQSCYIVFSDANNNITANLIVNPLQLKWKINSSYSETTATLARGTNYNLKLVLYSGGKELDYYSEWAFTQKDEYFTLSNSGALSIKYNALVGYDIVITPTVAPDYLLTITIGYNNGFTYSVVNGDNIEFTWNTTLYNEALQNVIIKIVSGGNTYTKTLTSKSGTINLNSYISTSTGTSTISIVSIKISGIVFANGTNYLNRGSTSINNLYAGGSGTSSSPYTISCYRHLNNIRKNTSSSVYYKLLNSIDMSGKGNWTPIPSFYGTINGNYCYIKNMKLNVNTSGDDYGFIKYNYGTLNNLKFSNVTIYTTVSEVSVVMYIGVVVGRNTGSIKNCDIFTANIDVQFFKSYVGGICGYNLSGTIYDSDVNSLTMKASGYAGGVTGRNNATVEYCYVTSSNITYYWNTDNGCIGGVVGYNTSNGNITRCQTSAYIEWNSTSNNSSILPCLGKLIGRNAGTYSNCTANGGWHIYYYYWHFIGWYDQSDRCFKVADGYVGYNG